MQGRKEIETRLFYHISLEQLVPQDHLVRRLAETLDLKWVRLATAQHYSRLGRPSLDPVVIAKLLILGYLYDISSERQLMREVQVNLAYRWYVGYDLEEAIPHHSDLSKARKRFGVDLFERLFRDILQRCQQAGLVGGQTVLIDSTVVQANASVDSVVPVLHYRPAEYWEQLEQASESVSDNPESPAKTPVPSPDTGAELASEPAETSAEPMGHKRPRVERHCDKKSSKTDSEASLFHRPGQESKMAYKAHVMADSRHGVITAVSATAASEDDTAAVPNLLDQHQSHCGRPERAVADHLYGSQDCLGFLQDRGIETVIPPRQGGNKHGGISKREFQYDAQADVYHCPGGQVLVRRRRQDKDGKVFYSAATGICGACALRADCVRSQSPNAVRQVTRYDNGYVERAEAACHSPHGRRLLRRRQTCIEGLFGQAKNWHGLGRARWRGRAKMRVQVLLTAAVLNLKKRLKVVSDRKAAVAKVCEFSKPCRRSLSFRFSPADFLYPLLAGGSGYGASPIPQ